MVECGPWSRRRETKGTFSHITMCGTLHIRWRSAVPTNLALDDKLIDEARRIGGHATKKEAVTAALGEHGSPSKAAGDFEALWNRRF